MEEVYYYSFKNGIFKVDVGTIDIEYGILGRRFVNFKPLNNPKHTVRFEGIYNEVLGTGVLHIWMTERDDELARKLFIEYEESMINDFLNKIDNKKKLIDILKNLA